MHFKVADRKQAWYIYLLVCCRYSYFSVQYGGGRAVHDPNSTTTKITTHIPAHFNRKQAITINIETRTQSERKPIHILI